MRICPRVDFSLVWIRSFKRLSLQFKPSEDRWITSILSRIHLFIFLTSLPTLQHHVNTCHMKREILDWGGESSPSSLDVNSQRATPDMFILFLQYSCRNLARILELNLGKKKWWWVGPDLSRGSVMRMCLYGWRIECLDLLSSNGKDSPWTFPPRSVLIMSFLGRWRAVPSVLVVLVMLVELQWCKLAVVHEFGGGCRVCDAVETGRSIATRNTHEAHKEGIVSFVYIQRESCVQKRITQLDHLMIYQFSVKIFDNLLI